MNCTGTYISNEGHFITADHCIQACFTFGEDWQTYIDYQSFEDREVFKPKPGPKQPDYFVLKRFRTEKIRDKYFCDVKVNGVMKKANLIAAGKGRLFPYSQGELYSEKLKQQYRTLLENGVWAASDFAILQLVEKPQTPCMPLGNRKPAPGEKLRVVSYTCVPTPSRPQNPEGDVALYSEGIPAVPEFFTGQSKEMLTDGSTPPNTFWSNLDGETCSSGSAVIGEDGKILGIYNMLQYRDKRFGPLVNLVRLSGTAEIQAAIESQAKEKFQCRQ